MAVISLFNNKGGVGKTTLSFHLSSTLAEMRKKVLMIDLDPQCNLTMYSKDVDSLYDIWKEEDSFIDDGFDLAQSKLSSIEFDSLITRPRTIHFILQPTEDGVGELSKLPPPLKIENNLDLIPGRLTLYKFENVISERWSGAYQGLPLSIRTITQIRNIANQYAKQHGYDYVIIDTSPSLGSLNKVIISTVDAFLVPCLPDMFSLYGIRNIGNSLKVWKKEIETIFSLISDEKRNNFPKKFVQFLGYTIYNAKKYTNQKNKWNLATAHYNYATQIPDVIEKYIENNVRVNIQKDTLNLPVGDNSIMHGHNTFTEMSQKYHVPMWKVPDVGNLGDDANTVLGNKKMYYATKDAYKVFAEDFLQRIKMSGL